MPNVVLQVIQGTMLRRVNLRFKVAPQEKITRVEVGGPCRPIYSIYGLSTYDSVISVIKLGVQIPHVDVGDMARPEIVEVSIVPGFVLEERGNGVDCGSTVH